MNRYTKEQLMGSLFRWPSGNYQVVENGEDVQIMRLKDGSLHSSYNLDYLNNNCLDYLVLETLNKNIAYEIY